MTDHTAPVTGIGDIEADRLEEWRRAAAERARNNITPWHERSNNLARERKERADE